MSFIKRIWEKIRRSESVLYPTFQIDSSKCLDENKSASGPIKARQNYFEISLTEQFLKDRREYWNEYIPLTLFLTEFIYANERRSFPFVVGPDLLQSLEQIEGDENIRYKNTRVVGPTPYHGDNVTLFAGLFRVRTKNWAAQTIGLLETVAKSFDPTKLSSYVAIAEPLLTGIEGFFGMGDDMQFRIGQRDEYRDSEIHATNVFRSGYWVMIRENQDNIAKENFWVKDSQLYYGKRKNSLEPYKESDYLLFEISASDKRNDYETFEFHEHWENARIAVIRKNAQQAETEFESLKVKLLSSKDIIESQKNQLLLMYLGMYEKIKNQFLKKSPTIDVAESLKSNQDFLQSKGIQIHLPIDAAAITSKFIKAKETEFTDANFVIDQKFMEDALDNPILNQIEMMQDIGNINPSIEILKTEEKPASN